MSWRDEDFTDDERLHVSRRNRDGTRRRGGIFLGPLRITATRVTVLIALVGSAAFLVYAITVRESSQIPMLVAGSAVLGVVFAALALGGAISTYRAGSYGQGGRAFGMALLGGFAALVAFGAFSAAVILALVYRP